MKAVNFRTLACFVALMSLSAMAMGAVTVSLAITGFGHKDEGEGEYDIVNYNAVVTGAGAGVLEVYCWDNTADEDVLVDSYPAINGNNPQVFRRGDGEVVAHDNNDFDVTVHLDDENGSASDFLTYSHP